MSLPTVTATRVCVKNIDTGTVYYTKGSGTVITASMTKMMTLRILLNYPGIDLDNTTTAVTADMVGGSTLGLINNDVISLRNLIVGMMVPSGNDCAMAAARYVGQAFLDSESGGAGDPIARFVTEMNSEASALGMSSTTYVDPSGLSSSNVSSIEDNALLYDTLRDELELKLAFRHLVTRVPISRGGAATLVTSGANQFAGWPGVFLAKSGSLDPIYNSGILWEAPNGQVVFVGTMGSTTSANRLADVDAILDQLPIDFPALATPGTPFTPGYLFNTLGYGGGWWDGSDNSNMKQLSGGTTNVTATSDPVGYWLPKAGTSGPYFRQATSGDRPLWNSAGYVTFDGSTDYLDLGATSIGGTALYADSSDTFFVGAKFLPSGTTGTILARAGASTSARQFQLFFTTGSEPAVYLRGIAHFQTNGVTTGGPHSSMAWWDGERGAVCSNILASTQSALNGTASAEATENILMGARTSATRGALLNGRIYQLVIVDVFDVDAFRRTRDWLNGAAVNAFADPTGGVGAAPTLLTASAINVTSTSARARVTFTR